MCRLFIIRRTSEYSLDAQKTKMKAFCDYNEYEIAGEYEDAGKSGKSIEGTMITKDIRKWRLRMTSTNFDELVDFGV